MTNQEYLGLISLMKTLESNAVNRKFLFLLVFIGLCTILGFNFPTKDVNYRWLQQVLSILLALVTSLAGVVSIIGVYMEYEKLIKLINENRDKEFDVVIELPEIKKFFK